ncbi:TPR/MLP1/MLP2-like protein-domain-containing protein [Zopfochytrium polystomum]|nr:TPR/MLP1/MLP2-like protein-domain-containing protein [Zopfochytrium polystomum]
MNSSTKIFKETGSDTKALKQANEALLKEKSDLSIQIARLNSSIDYVNERYKTLSESSELQRNENNQLRDRIGTLMNNLTSQDSKAQELSNQIVELRLSLENAQTEIRQLRGERDVLRSSEARCAAENEGLMQQRNMANEHLKSLQRMYDELDRQSRDSAARSEEKLARLEKELEAVRHQLSSASDDLRTLNARRDLDMRDAQTKIEKLNGELAQALRDRDVAMFEASSGKEKVADITTRLHAMEEKLSVYEGRVGTTNQRGSEAEIIKDLQSELAQTRSDLEMAKEALQLERQRVEQYNSIASASELKLIEFNTTYDKFKEDMDAKLTESERTIAQLERLRDDLEERLSRAHTEVVSLQKKADDEKEEFKMTEDRLKDEIARIRKSDEDAQHSIRLLQEQNRAQDVRLAESMELYYGIIRKEAEHMKALQKAEEELRELRSVVDGHKAQASAAERNLKAAEKSWQLTRDTLDSEIVALQGQLTDLTEQNHILHSQFEAINTRLESLHNPSQIGAEENIQASSDKNLADVIRYLRRENDILDKKHEVALQQSIRLQQQVEHLQRSLDETRQSLDNEREQRQGVVDAEKMHKELLDKIDSLNILRESNATLRSQNEMNMKRIAFLEARLSEKDSEVGPLRASNHNLKAEIEALQAQIKQLEVDNNYWKGRTQLILAKYDRIDPVEHQQLKDRAADLQATCDSLTKQLELAKEKLAEFDSTLAEAQEARVRTEADLRRLNEESAANWADERRKLVERSNEITKRMRERLTSLTAEKSALQTQLDLLAAEKSNAESVAAAKLDELKALKATADGAAARVTSLESDLSQTQQQLKESRKIITSLELAASAPKNLIALPGGPSSTIAQSPAPVTDASTAALQPLAKAVQPPAAVNNVTAVPSPSSSVKRPREEEGPNKISVPSVVEAPSMTTAATVNLSVAPAQTPSATEEPLQKRAKTSSEGEDGEIKGMEDISPEPSAIKDDAAQVLHSSRQQQEQSLLVPPTASPVSPALAPPAKQNVAIKPPHDTPLFSALKANPVDATASVRASTSVTTTPVKIRRTGVTAESNGNDESTAVGAGNVTKPATPTGPTTSSTAPASTASPSTPIASAVVAAAKPTSTLPSLSSAPNALQPDSRQAPPSASDPPAIASDSSQKKRQLNELLRRKLAAVNQAAAPDAANGTNNPANSAQNLNLTTSTVTPPSEATARKPSQKLQTARNVLILRTAISTPLPVRRQRIDRSSVVPGNRKSSFFLRSLGSY